MAGNKKKKTKPVANPARGFATTSLPSKPRVEASDAAESSAQTAPAADKDAPQSSQATAGGAPQTTTGGTGPGPEAAALSAEEFERQLEESELQLQVEKYAQKVRRDAQRQKNRLDTDRRLLRSSAEPLNIKKWLPPELVEQILDLIQLESRYASSGLVSEPATANKLSEEDLTIKLWTLQQTLILAGFSEERVQSVLQFILDIASSVSVSNKESIWGLEESLDWLARECPKEELPDYEARSRPKLKALPDTPGDSPVPSGATTPRQVDAESRQRSATLQNKGLTRTESPQQASPRKAAVTYDSDIEPDDLVPAYLSAKAKLYELQRGNQDTNRAKSLKPPSKTGGKAVPSANNAEIAKLQAKISRIEKDVLFDKALAEQQWRSKRILLEKELAQKARDAKPEPQKDSGSESSDEESDSDDEINKEAKKIAAEVLAENGDKDDDGMLADLFSSLPMSEVDPATGKTNTVINAPDGTKVVIRDFGKWVGVSPSRVLEEACRARDSSVKIKFTLISEATFANRHMVAISWTKPQEPVSTEAIPDIEVEADTTRFVFRMMTIATPDAKQSEAYIATTALFHIFGVSAKEEKVFMRLPPAWRDLWSEFAETKKNKSDAEDRAAIKTLRDMVRKKRDQDLEDGVVLQGAFRGRGTPRLADNGEDSGTDRARVAGASPEYFQQIWYGKVTSPKFQQMLQYRIQLPMWAFRQQVLDAVDAHQVVIICGETGCGKSTQVPSFLLEHQLTNGKHCKIYCTQPRRISAVSLARRVSEELGEDRRDLGTPRSLVGYAIRLESKMVKETRLVYATTGIVMRMLEGSNDLKEITHLVLDEVHERSIDSDFLLIVLKKLMERRKDLKVVLMSATVDADRFSKYLGGAPVLNVPGRTFPVTVKYLEDAIELTGYTLDKKNQERIVELDDDVVDYEEDPTMIESVKQLKQYSARTRATLTQFDEYRIDFDLIVQLLTRIATDEDYVGFSKAILVFLPGFAEIHQLHDLLLGDRFFSSGWLIYPLHSSIATEEQEAAFLIPPPGYRKIVLATNIAETGITIPDVTCVIDTGKHREMRFDERRQMSRLIDAFISRANAKQRRGRAGRVQEGLCFHLFTKHRHDEVMADNQTPEMLRLSLQDLAIRVKMCRIGGIEETLSQALDAPSPKNIRRAIDALVDVRALNPATEELTPLGRQLARLPLDVFLGKLMLLGTTFRCLDMAVTVAAVLSGKTPFAAPFGQRAQADAARKSFRRGDSDLLTVYGAYLAWKRVCQSATSAGGGESQFCRKNFLSQQALSGIEEIKGQLVTSLVDSGVLELTEEEKRALARVRYGGGGGGGRRRYRQQFVDLPARANVNSDNDVVMASVIAWAFYPKLLVRDGGLGGKGGGGLRNVANNQIVSIHPSSVNKGHGELRWLSYYNIMQAKGFYNAHETTAVDPFAVALLCGDVRVDMFSGVAILDGNRARLSLPDWKTALALKVLRQRLRDMLARTFRDPGKTPTPQHEKWMDCWQRVFAAAWEYVTEKERAKGE